MDFIKIYVAGIIIFCLVYYVGIFIFMKRKKENTQKWLLENPSASKIFVESKSFMENSGLYIKNVDGQTPVTFYEGRKGGIYLLPGNHIIEAMYSQTRPGIIYKRVTKTYGPVKTDVKVETGKTYKYFFDKKNKNFIFTEITLN
ncbi:hypothetical protein EII29_02885 [Leptotrichia sp. OH3620_COT-345]|uniref:hypothetical protein n=1 Tax=Leptotrichia sp. OH3620_COT-345 TaxID=2491048 RepID=UPI000F646213|nr:hypothetical protein [Leptotrichia sp. OH3620_COT-345]RRD40438.1 hypothetical protein EII29_02885 [Leptotrichia sp. OH3620_COT-345]